MDALSPQFYDNPWYMADENGNTLDYISATRMVHELSQEENETERCIKI